MADYTIWPATNGPSSSSADSPVNLATEFYVTSTAWLKAIRFYRADTAITGSVQGRVWQAINGSSGSAVSGTDVTFSLSGTGWQQANLATPVQLTANTRYKAACLFPSGYSATANYWSSGGGSSGHTNGILVAPNNAGSVAGDTQGCYAYNATLTYPTNGSPNAGCYWVDVVVTDTDPGGGAEVRVVLDLAAETDTAQTLTSARVVALGLVSEVDTAYTPAPVRFVPLALASEAGTAQTLTPAHVTPVALASETGTAHPLAAMHAVPLALASEEDTAHPLSPAHAVLLDLASELDTAPALVTAGPPLTEWRAPTTRHGWTAPTTRTGWTAGRLTT